MRKKVKDDEGNEYEIEIDDEDDGEEDEDDENIYLTEADLRWLKEARKAASGSQQKTEQSSKKKSSGIPVKKRSSNSPTDITSGKKSRIRRLTLSA